MKNEIIKGIAFGFGGGLGYALFQVLPALFAFFASMAAKVQA